MRKLFAFIPLVLITQMFAQQATQQLRLTDCISMALGKNPTIQISQAKVQAAEARFSEASTALLPQLKFSGRFAELSPVEPYTLTLPIPPVPITRTLFPSITENYSLRLSLQQPLFTGYKISKYEEMAELNAGASREDLTKDKSDLVMNVIAAYWHLYKTFKIEEVIRQSVEQMSEHLKDIKNLSKQGMATDADEMKVRVLLSDVKVKHIEAKNAIRLATMALNSLIGNQLALDVVPGDVPVMREDANKIFQQEELIKLQVLASEKRPEIKSMHLRRNMNNANVVVAKSGWYPQVYLSANYDYARPNQRIIPPNDRWDRTWDVGITLQWNVWDWNATRYQTDQAEAVLRQSEQGLAQIEDAVAMDVAQQYFSLQSANEKVQVSVEGVQQAQESFRMTSEKFKNGFASNTDLLDAEVALLQAKLAHTNAVVECTLSEARLKKAIGENL